MQPTKFLMMVVLGVIFVTSCQKAKDPSPTTQAQPQKEEVKKSPELKTNVAIQDEGPIEVVNSPLTEEEQKEFEKIGGALERPQPFKTDKEAMNYLKLLIKGGPRTIRWYQTAIKENRYTQQAAREWYEGDLAVALSHISPESKDGLDIIIEVIKTKSEYPIAIAKAARALKYSKDPSVSSILNNLAKQPSPRVRLEAAGSLLSLGDVDAALPVLDKLAEQEGLSGALYYLFREKGKIIDERGYTIVEKALNYQTAEVRISAASILCESKRLNKARLEEIALDTLNVFKGTKEYGIMFDPKKGIVPIPGKELTFENSLQQQGSDWRAINSAISILVDLKSKKAVPALEKLANNPEGSYLANSAARAIKNLKSR